MMKLGVCVYRYKLILEELGFFCFYFRLKSRDLVANAFSISELPEGSADPVELAARVEDGSKKKNYFK